MTNVYLKDPNEAKTDKVLTTAMVIIFIVVSIPVFLEVISIAFPALKSIESVFFGLIAFMFSPIFVFLPLEGTPKLTHLL